MIAILFNRPAGDAPADERDVEAQVALVREALAGREHRVLACDLDLARLRAELTALRPSVVVNLVEALAGEERLILAVPALLDSLGLRYTGATLEGLLCSTDKVVAKRLLAAADIPTPPWSEDDPAVAARGGRAILKSRWRHGSVGIEADAIVGAGGFAAARERLRAAPGDLFAEAFIDGREFNLSLLEEPGGVRVLPPAEIRFEGFGERPHIVGWRAKWDEASFEYVNTPRCFDFALADAPLLARLERLARASWQALRLRGYARVDFRVDGSGAPFVLEANANPCLAPDAGFIAATARAGLSSRDVIASLLSSAIRGQE